MPQPYASKPHAPAAAGACCPLPGLAQDDRMVDQVTWFQNWLTQASFGAAGRATLWILGSNVADGSKSIYTNEMCVVLGEQGQGIDNPDLVGVTSYVFDAGEETIGVDFGGDRFSLYGGCLRARTYDGLGASGTAVVSHRYRNATDASMGEGAIVLNSSPAENWNTIFTAFPWSDLRDPGRVPTSPQPETLFLQRVLGAVLPVACVLDPTPTGVVGGSEAKARPRVSALHANVKKTAFKAVLAW